MEYINVLPGRVRFKSLDIYYNTKLAKYIEKYIHSLYGVKSSKVTENTGSILIVYDISKTNLKLLKDNIETALSSSIVKNNNDFKVFDKYFECIEKKKRAKKKFLLWSIFYLLLKTKISIFGKFSISRNLNILKIAAAVTIIGGYPLIKSIYKKFTKFTPNDSEILLELFALSFTVLRESSEAVLVLILKALNDYINFHSEAESRKALLDSYTENFKMAWTKSTDGTDVLISIDSLKVGEYIYVYPGEIVPATGIITEGNAIINSLYSTGQPLVSHIEKGLEINEGVAIISGYVKIKITNLPHISEKKDIPQENLSIYNKIKKFENKMTYIALGAASLSLIFTGNILNAFSVMLVLNPNATSIALNSGIKNYLYLLNKNNIYFQNPNVFENIIKIDKILFDKTGTLTYGNMKIISVASFNNKYTKNDILRISSACEIKNYHPISITLQDYYDHTDIAYVESSVLIPSKGVKATYANKDILIGSEDLMKDNNIDISLGIEKYQYYQSNSLIPIFVAINKNLVGIIVLDDILRKNSKELIHRLKNNNINDISLLTGDSNAKAQKIASQLGIDKVYSNKNYLEKAQVVKSESINKIVMMVGDGINDVMAMRAAHISVSFANSSCDTIKLHSDCIIHDDDMLALENLILLSRESYNSINRTILLSNLYNIILGSIAFGGGLNVFTAKYLNTLNSLLVLIINKRILLLKSNKVNKHSYLKQNVNKDNYLIDKASPILS